MEEQRPCLVLGLRGAAHEDQANGGKPGPQALLLHQFHCPRIYNITFVLNQTSVHMQIHLGLSAEMCLFLRAGAFLSLSFFL